MPLTIGIEDAPAATRRRPNENAGVGDAITGDYDFDDFDKQARLVWPSDAKHMASIGRPPRSWRMR
jgi:hypothetical protein